MKVLIQINCLNEEEVLEQTLNDLPKEIQGVDILEVLIVNDGSTDKTSDIAKKWGVKEVISHPQNKGLPFAVNTGMYYAINNQVDILVNTDADGQYKGEDIEKLISPILSGQADFVYGERQIDEIGHFSDEKKLLQKMGARVVSLITGIQLQDAASGFRALSSEAMQRILLLSDYASPLESFIQAKMKNLGIKIIKIHPRRTIRPSRLVKSNFLYVFKSAIIILDNLFIYRPLQIFAALGFFLSFLGTFVGAYRYSLVVQNPQHSHLTLLALAIMFWVLGVQLFFFGLSARLQRANRLIVDEIFYRNNGKISKSHKV